MAIDPRGIRLALLGMQNTRTRENIMKSILEDTIFDLGGWLMRAMTIIWGT